jgi:hypothetical protein
MLHGKSRDAFLEFLRNLTPQGLFLACFFILAKELEKPLLEDKTILLLACLGCFIVFNLAFIANCIKFVEAILESQSDDLKVSFERIEKTDISHWGKLRKKIVASWRHDKGVLSRGFLAVSVVSVSLLPVTMVAIKSI